MRTVIFDIDGTLVDSVDVHAKAWQEALRHFGHDVSFLDVRRQIGKGGDKLLPVFLSEKKLAKFGKQLEEYRAKIFKRDYLHLIKPFPCVRELFQCLLGNGARIGLASSAKAEEVEYYKKLAGIDDLIHAETSFDDVEESKPAPDIFAAALERLGNPNPREAIAVGDTPYDAQAGGKIGLRTVGVLCGGFPENDLRAAGCIAIYKDPCDLLAHYAESPLAEQTAA